MLARADDVAQRRKVSLLHFANALLLASPKPLPAGFFRLGDETRAPATGDSVNNKRKRGEGCAGKADFMKQTTVAPKTVDQSNALPSARARFMQNLSYQRQKR